MEQEVKFKRERGRHHVRLIFFSSRRRHPRYWRDWSSDVCSSDLGVVNLVAEPAAGFRPGHGGGVGVGFRYPRVGGSLTVAALKRAVLPPGPGDPVALGGVALYEPLILGRGQLRDLVTFLGDVFAFFLRRIRSFCVEEFPQMVLRGPPR